ncbi:phage tail family protein [Planococcus kocurii]|uniref:phage tail family protein n=1 Tax=Planococcus kocurii TaxID=1374 RepID=UPI003D04E072
MGGVTLYDMSMTKVAQRGVKWFEFIPEPPSYDESTEKIYNGEIPMGKTRNSRMISAKFWLKGYDALDYKLLRDEVYGFLSPRKDFFVVDSDLPGKRWKVSVESVTINRLNRRIGEGEVTFKAHRGIAESLDYSMDQYNTDNGRWTTGMGIESDADKQDYFHNTSSFMVFNAGNVVVDPRESELKITINATNGGSGTIKLKNLFTGEEWMYTGTTNAGDTFIINKMVTQRNFANAVGNTNLQLVSLLPGNNPFTLTGLNAGFNVAFDFRFLYE